MERNNKTSQTAATESEAIKLELILNLLKHGRITSNESRTLMNLEPVDDANYDKLLKKVE